MSQTAFTVKILIDGLPATGLTVLMSDPEGLYGVRRNDTDEVVVADGAAMTELGGGVYTHVFDNPDAPLSYTGWVEYVFEGETYRFSQVFQSSESPPGDTGATTTAVICREDRAAFATRGWTLSGLNTSAAGNTAGGKLWLKLAREDDAIVAAIYRSAAETPDSRVASGSVDAALLAGGPVAMTLEADSEGLHAEFTLESFAADASCELLAALCTDEDLRLRYAGLDTLSSCDACDGFAAFIAEAGREVLDRVAAIFAGRLGGNEAADLHGLVESGALRRLTALKALALALGREHQHAEPSSYSTLRDHFEAHYEREFSRLCLFTDDDLAQPRRQNVLRLSRA